MPLVRCAIYTRSSSEEGLDQAFNSLHAQREACEAYVMSQAGEGWRALPMAYDDGGFSGGTIERPALRRLLADITAGKVDTVVVYKIDRLTRSLSDFAKIVDRLDAAGASFVSVTQAFNTTTSMGRLTLNVLLSFAQFEREVTGERIRDKIAASKAKGMWMGGTLPLGYDRPTDPLTRALVVNPAEAETVRRIFAKYLELGSVSQLELWLRERGISSKVTRSRRGEVVGGSPIGRGAIFHLLKNRLYLGEIPHKQQSFPGAHPGIVDAELFAAVQAMLERKTVAHKTRPVRAAQAPLRGIIFDADGHPMSPVFARGSGGQPYRYYVSSPLQRGQQLPRDDGQIRRLPAVAVEEVVSDRLRRIARMDACGMNEIRRVLSRVEVHARSIVLLASLAAMDSGTGDDEIREVRIVGRLLPGEAASIEGEFVRIRLPVRLQARGGRIWLKTSTGRDAIQRPKVDRVLVNALRVAHGFAAEMGHYRTVAAAKAPARPYDRQIVLLAFLAPDIQQAILQGRQPASFKLERLLQEPPPLDWFEQRAVFGF